MRLFAAPPQATRLVTTLTLDALTCHPCHAHPRHAQHRHTHPRSPSPSSLSSPSSPSSPSPAQAHCRSGGMLTVAYHEHCTCDARHITLEMILLRRDVVTVTTAVKGRGCFLGRAAARRQASAPGPPPAGGGSKGVPVSAACRCRLPARQSSAPAIHLRPADPPGQRSGQLELPHAHTNLTRT